MPFLAPEMQQVLAGILAAILWTYFQGGRMCFKKMKSDEIELLRSDWYRKQYAPKLRFTKFFVFIVFLQNVLHDYQTV